MRCHVLQFLCHRSSSTILWPDYNPANLQTSLETTPFPYVVLSWRTASIQASLLPTWRRRYLYLRKQTLVKTPKKRLLENIIGILTSVTHTRGYIDRTDVELRIIVAVIEKLTCKLQSRPAFGDVHVLAVPHIHFATKVENQSLKIKQKQSN